MCRALFSNGAGLRLTSHLHLSLRSFSVQVTVYRVA